MTNEVWKDVVGYEDYYEVSTLGRVRSKPRLVYGNHNKPYEKPQKLLKTPLRCGYPSLHLTKDGVSKNRTVHSLVAEAFLEKVKSSDIVRHINDIKTDNRLSNLTYGSYLDNEKDRVKNGIFSVLSAAGHKHPRSKVSKFERVFIANLKSYGFSARDIHGLYFGNLTKDCIQKIWTKV